MGRPPTRPIKLKDGFYIEVRNKNAASGVKVRRSTREQMELAIQEYGKSKEVIVLGEMRDGKWVDEKKKK
ncbi:MAG TPA: hypothetical protein ENJ39_01345 [Flammeovirgaceae bacterium]|nr:hypothetical protein [Flammeovirgaceae bacterium]